MSVSTSSQIPSYGTPRYTVSNLVPVYNAAAVIEEVPDETVKSGTSRGLSPNSYIGECLKF